MASSKTYIPELSTWRLIFILMIFFHHVKLWSGGGSAGVAFFFILGGFTLTLGYSEKVLESKFDYGRYLKRRLIKFYPLHWLVLFLFVILNYLCSVPSSALAFGSNFLLLQSFIPIKEVFYSYNSPSWYLCNTVFFAVLFPFIYRLLSKVNGKKWFYLAVLYIVLIIVEFFTPEDYWLPILYINPIIRLFDFVIGVIIAMAYLRIVNNEEVLKKLRGKQIMAYLAIILSIITIIIFTRLDLGVAKKAFAYWIPIALLILATSILSITSEKNPLKNKILVSLGGVSFAFYMIHSFVINVVQVASIKIGVTNPWIIVPITLALTIAGSYLVTSYFINPITKWLNSKLIK